MPRVCQKCGVQITCGCQDRIAADGTAACSACVDKYNRDLSSPPMQPLQNLDYNNVVTKNEAPVINSISHKFNNFET